MCDSWIRNKDANPITKRTIKENTELYKEIESF